MSVAALLATGSLLLAGGHGPGHGGAPVPATPADGPTVTMDATSYLPSEVVALVGETVSWSNTDGRNHTVTGDELDSGAIAPGGVYAHAFEMEGTYRYHCTIHRFMSGSVRVFGLAFDAAPGAVQPGSTVRVSGRAPAGTATVLIERRDRAGGPYVPVLELRPAADGAFAARVGVPLSASFRARTGELTSRALPIRLVPAVHAHAHRAGANVRLEATVHPRPPGATAVLQRYLRERFAWRSVARARIGRAGTVRFRLRTRDEVYLRVLVTGARGGFADGASRSVRVPSLRR